ncbi:MAG: aminoglycoside phosphotransferase, partial [Acidimicrobiales bacterium]
MVAVTPVERALTPRPVATSLDELLAGADSREPFHTPDSKSGARFERVTISGERLVLKHLHVDDDWIMRSSGDLGCRPLLVWRAGLLDVLPPGIDHAIVGAATGLGRNGWGAALLMHDVSQRLVPPGDGLLPAEQAERFLDHMAQLSARFWGFRDTIGLTPPVTRWQWFGPGMLDVEAARGFPEPVPRVAVEGWERFARRARGDVARMVDDLRHDVGPLVDALAGTPTTFLHGDWKLGNLGSRPDGRTILLDWAAPGEGPACHDLAWYLALNRARLPHSKEHAIGLFRRALERHGVETAGWWERQLGLCLLGALVLFGWEKALGDAEELGWWCDRA